MGLIACLRATRSIMTMRKRDNGTDLGTEKFRKSQILERAVVKLSVVTIERALLDGDRPLDVASEGFDALVPFSQKSN